MPMIRKTLMCKIKVQYFFPKYLTVKTLKQRLKMYQVLDIMKNKMEKNRECLVIIKDLLQILEYNLLRLAIMRISLQLPKEMIFGKILCKLLTLSLLIQRILDQENTT